MAGQKPSRMPVVFFGHGSPTIIREENNVTASWRAIAQNMPRPRGIVIVSAHWVTPGEIAVTAMPQPKTIHDFGTGLGEDLFAYHYPAPGSPALAQQVSSLLEPANAVRPDTDWGLDHGSWSVLLKAFPDADIPVVQLSLFSDHPSKTAVELGRRLRPLRDEQVLISASGNIVHNLGVMEWSEHAEPYDWAETVNQDIKQAVMDRDEALLVDPFALGDIANRAIPTAEHYTPLLYAYGASDANDIVSFNPDFIQYKSLSMTSITWNASDKI